MILLKNRDRNPSFKKGEYIEINDAGNYPMELSIDGVCEQETTKGYQLLDITNNFESHPAGNGYATYKLNEKGGIELVSGNEGWAWGYTNSQVKVSLEAGTYIASANLDIRIYNSDGTQLENNFTLAETANIGICCKPNSTKGACYIIVEQGSTAHEYEPYTGGQPSPSPDYPQPISVIENSLKITSCNKNLFNSNLKKGGRLFSNGKYFSANNYIHNEQPLKVIGGRTYTISAKGYNSSFEAGFVFFKDGKFVSSIKQKSTTVTIPNDVNELYYDFSLGTSTIIDIDSFSDYQLELGPAATEYEPYQGSSLNITIPSNEFIGKLNDTYKDTLKVVYKDDGHYHLILNKMIGKVVLDGSEEGWLYDSNNKYFRTNTYVFERIPLSLSFENKAMYSQISNSFIINKNWSGTNSFRDNINVQGEFYPVQNKGYKLAFRNLNFDNVDDFKSYLSSKNIIVVYPLETPYEVDLGIVDTLLSYDKITNIFSDSDLLPTINVKYYKDFEFDKILRSGYNIDEQEYEIAKKQMANGKRKRILSSYDDCIIKINLGLLDNKTYQEYKEQLDDGEFHYWSYKYNQYKKANFILTKPSITTEYAYDDDIGINDMEITLEKSSDIE